MIARSHIGLRVAGLAVAVTILVAAGQLLAISFDRKPIFDSEATDRFDRWVRSAPSAGGAMLGGIALIAVGFVVTVAVARARGVDQPVVPVRRGSRRSGRISIDRKTLADALERELVKVDQRADVDVKVRRSGRIDLNLVTPDPTPTGSALDIGQRLDQILSERKLPCRSGRVRATRPRKVKGRRRVR